jgi:hypothetical protein
MKQLVVTRVLTAAEVNALDNTVEQTIVAGITGKILKFRYAFFGKRSGTAVGSATTETLKIVYAGDTTALGVVGNSDLTAILGTGATAADYLNHSANATTAVSVTNTLSKGKGISILGATGGTIQNFDGTLQVTIVCDIIDLQG